MLPLILVTVATAGGIAGLLLAEKPWEIVALTAAVIVALLISVRRGWDRTTLAAAVNHRPVVAVLAIATIAGLGALLREDNFALLMLATALLYATACIGLTLQFGYAGVVNFAGAAFFGCGAYTATVLATHTPLPHVLVL
ncbi:MAG: branched-chain amino acid ABC transporter permease, partial [Burkholderiales bacterium]|nr:branched-chain amino acid ABC transporter permease [Burkholderiales bacterium]